MIDTDTREEYEKEARVYVVMRDNFLSGWGHAPSISYYVIACPSVSIAEKVAYYAENTRTEMKYVSIRFGTVKEALSSRRITENDHVSITGVNPQWCGWGWSDRNADEIRKMWD
tara:strand:- start:3045 stop:3386 length:342 start_codon:yes stop_codon:yes gene_type:complete